MRRRSPSIALFCAVTVAAPAYAADHADSPGAIADPAADITDLYAWTSGSLSSVKVNLVLNVQAALFSDAVSYVFHVAASTGPGLPEVDTEIICHFSVDQRIECWIGDGIYLAGDASNSTGLAGRDGLVRIFAGPRNDPFFFNLSGFHAVLGQVKVALPGFASDAAGCPLVTPNTANALVGQLMLDESQGPAVDGFAIGPGGSGLVSALVIQIDRSLLATGGNQLAVWASTHRR